MTSIVTKGLLVRSDIAPYDGVNDTVTRRDSTGGTITSLPINDFVDVLQVYGNGVSRTFGTVKNCVNRIGSTRNRTLSFSPGTWVIDQDLTIGSNFTCYVPAGCVFSVSSGKTLTFSGPVIRDAQTWTSGSGTVTESGTRYFSGAESHSGSVTFSGAVTMGTASITAATLTTPVISSLVVSGATVTTTGVLDRDVTVATVNNTAVETTVATTTVPANTLSTNRKIRLTAYGKLVNNSGGNESVTIKTIWGGSAISNGLTAIASGASRYYKIVSEVDALNATNSQLVAHAINDGASTMAFQASELFAKDDTTALALAISATLSTASANLTFSLFSATWELL